MTARPSFHPQKLHLADEPLARSGGENVSGIAAFDPSEARSYCGVMAAELVPHAKDIADAKHGRPRRRAAGARALARMDAILALAVTAYGRVKAALRLLASPLQSRSYQARANRLDALYSAPLNSVPNAPTIWVTRPPTQADWAARDAAAGYDLRGTSPTYILRRVYRYRAQRRRDIAPPLERAFRKGQQAARRGARTSEFIGPPTPRHYKEVDDLFAVWPPVALPAYHKPRSMSGDDASQDAPTDDCLAGHDYALEQFGAAGVRAYCATLPAPQKDHLDHYLRAQDVSWECQEGLGHDPPKYLGYG